MIQEITLNTADESVVRGRLLASSETPTPEIKWPQYFFLRTRTNPLSLEPIINTTFLQIMIRKRGWHRSIPLKVIEIDETWVDGAIYKDPDKLFSEEIHVYPGNGRLESIIKKYFEGEYTFWQYLLAYNFIAFHELFHLKYLYYSSRWLYSRNSENGRFERKHDLEEECADRYALTACKLISNLRMPPIVFLEKREAL